ncbi:hypothetical protein DEF23_02215 [Marinitenerispora sediminis]|uniref:DUF1707 domain-containing protein n=2 Tax=Marinitenerispora sediminis TaxID=1931232 RepID=A0A368TET2_9ACTN|nr:hypothetical protein DEF28_00400 [Marinitenerispora sediminis]RCV61457.1 hypothetical protein DEF23_02215 [Marinitenerispora sediminis]RCV62537.1 hypothetical protein DEF24_00750 [Marinitenerispora sediminis]
MRASDLDREQVAEILRQAATEGRITLDELDERLDLAYRARTYGDLRPLTADLPAGRGVPAPARQPGAGAVDRTLELRAKAGSIARRGNWEVPGRVVVSNPYGETRLNFREATLLTEVVDLEITASWGDAKIVLPDGATAAINVDTSWFGDVDSRVPERPAPPAPHFRITGAVKGGALRVRYKTRFDDWMGWDNWD